MASIQGLIIHSTPDQIGLSEGYHKGGYICIYVIIYNTYDDERYVS